MVIEKKKYNINEVFDMIGEEYLTRDNDNWQHKSDMVVDGFNVRPISLRYMTFYQKGIKCVCCGKEGTHFKLCGEEGTDRRHFNLYADDGTLFTKDHIIPKSKGGMDRVSNLQTMCTDCNLAKGSKHTDIQVEYIVGRNVHDGKELCFRSLEKAAFHLALHYTGAKKNKNEAMKIGINTLIRLIDAIEYSNPYHGFVWTKEMR